MEVDSKLVKFECSSCLVGQLDIPKERDKRFECLILEHYKSLVIFDGGEEQQLSVAYPD